MFRFSTFLSFFWLFSMHFLGQGTCSVDINTKDYTTEKSEGGILITVYDGSNVVGTYTTSGKGKSKFELPLGKNYKIELSKGGKVSRYFMVNTANINPETLPVGEGVGFAVDVKVFNQDPNADFSYVAANPFTTYTYDGSDPMLKENSAQGSKMAGKINQAMLDAAKKGGDGDVKYNEAIAKASEYEAKKDYQGAIFQYETAAGLKPSEKLPPAKIKELDALVRKEKENSIMDGQALDQYDALVSSGDKLSAARQYDKALQSYEEAKKLKPTEAAIQAKIDATQKLAANAKIEAENEAKYKAAMEIGANMEKQKSWKTALEQYKIALKLKKDDSIAADKIKFIEEKLSAEKNNLANVENAKKLFQEGEVFFNKEEYGDAKLKFEAAKELDPISAKIKQRIIDCNTKIAEQNVAKQKKEQIETLLNQGKTAFEANQMDQAKLKYDEVIKLDETNEIAKSQLAEILKFKANEANFTKLVAEGNAAVKAKTLSIALEKFKLAYDIKKDAAIQAQITDIESKLNNEKNKLENAQKFSQLISEGAALQTENKYVEAISKYNLAKEFDKVSTIPNLKIAECNKKLEELEKNQANALSFKKTMEEANALRDSKNYNEAKLKYNAAKLLDKTSLIPNEEIAKIDKVLADAKAGELASKAYSKAMEDGEINFKAGKFTDAITKFTEASNLDKSKSEPNERIAAANVKIQESKIQAEAKVSFNNAIKAGDDQLKAKNYEGAIAKYKEAKLLDETSTLPDTKIEAVAKAKQLELELANQAYVNAMEAGEILFSSGKFADAITKFNSAKNLNPSKTEPEVRIAEAQKRLQDSQDAATRKVNYQKAIAEGEAAEKLKNYEIAIAKYENAKSYDGSATLPSTRIEAIKKIIADNFGSTAKKAEIDGLIIEGNKLFANKNLIEAKEKFMLVKSLDETNAIALAKLKEIEIAESALLNEKQKTEKYNKLLAEGNTSLQNSKFEMAKTTFNEAKIIKDSPEVIQGIKEANEGLENEKLKKLVANYEAKLVTAESQVSANQYDNAIKILTEAELILKTDSRATKRKSEVIALRDGSKSAKELEANYNTIIAAADKLFKANKYSESIDKYREASSLKREETYPISQIEKANENLGSINKQNRFKEIMAQGDAYMLNKNFDDAVMSFSNALIEIPGEATATRKLELAKNAKIPSINLNPDYDKSIIEADMLFKEEKYQEASAAYNQALNFKKDDKYANEQRLESNRLSSLKTQEEAMQKNVQKIYDLADKLAGEEKCSDAIEKFNLAINRFKARNHDYAKRRITEIKTTCGKPIAQVVNVVPEVVSKAPSKEVVIRENVQIIKLDSLGLAESKSLQDMQAEIAQAQDNRFFKRGNKLKKMQEKELLILAKIDSINRAKIDLNTALLVDFKEKSDIADARVLQIQNDNTLQIIKSEKEIVEQDIIETNFQTTENLADEQYIELDKIEAQNTLAKNELFTKVNGDTVSAMVQRDYDYMAAREIEHTDINRENQTMVQKQQDVVNSVKFENDKMRAINAEEIENSSMDLSIKESKDVQIEQAKTITNEGVLTDLEFQKLKVESDKQKSMEEKSKKDIDAFDRLVEIKRLEVNKDESGRALKNESELSNQIDQQNILIEKQKGSTVQNSEGLKVIEKNISELENIKNLEQVENSQANTALITKEEQARIAAEDATIKTQGKNDQKVIENEKKLTEVYKNQDLEQTQKKLANEQIMKKDIETKSDEKEQTAKKVQLTVNELEQQKKKDAANALAQDKLQENIRKSSEDLLAKLEKRELKYSDGVANTLAKDYPEGVSQETFPRYDSEDVLIGQITRRIVVVGNRGDVYMRYQYANGITYSKNGQSCTEHIWQSETGNGKLKRNY